MTSFDIWLWLSLDNIRDLFAMSCIAVMVVWAWLGLVVFVEEDSINAVRVRKKFKLISVIFAPLLAFNGLGLVLVPSTKDMAVIYFLPKIVNNEQIQRVPEVVMKMLRDKLDDLEGIKKGEESDG